MMTVGLAIPALVPATLPAYIAYVSALGALAGLVFGANVIQKIGTKDTYIKELEMNKADDTVEDNDTLRGTH
jgi:hypothetical protein